jgi:hypothetical protein
LGNNTFATHSPRYAMVGRKATYGGEYTGLTPFFKPYMIFLIRLQQLIEGWIKDNINSTI